MFNTKAFFFATAILISFFSTAQNNSLSDTPRLVVYGEASVKADADVITCWLNIYDNNISYDYSIPYDDKKFKKDQQAYIERLGVKDYMSNPTYANLKSYVGSGPFELKFSSKSQYEAVQKKIQDNYNESMSVSMDIAKTEISDTKRKQLYDQTLDQAVADAASKAQKMAASLKATIGTPVYIEEMRNDSYSVYPPLSASYDYDYGYGNTDMQVTISSRVQLQYLIK